MLGRTDHFTGRNRELDVAVNVDSVMGEGVVAGVSAGAARDLARPRLVFEASSEGCGGTAVALGWLERRYDTYASGACDFQDIESLRVFLVRKQ